MASSASNIIFYSKHLASKLFYSGRLFKNSKKDFLVKNLHPLKIIVKMSSSAAEQVAIKVQNDNQNQEENSNNIKTINNNETSTTNSISESSELNTLENNGTTSNITPEVVKRARIRKFAIMLSYCGVGYYGMQKNPMTITIEEEFFKSLLQGGYINKESADRPQLINFQRCARTDKGVSAARQVVSVKLPEDLDIPKINSLLPSQIKVMGFKRVTKSFDSKDACDYRTYSYITPSFAFSPVTENITDEWRITPEILNEIRELLKKYVGVKNFHNFTSRKKPTDPSAKRLIKTFTCSEPFVRDGIEFLLLQVKGQSFMLHQIRKMVGLAIAILRGFASHDTIDKAYTLDRIDIPRAPGVGLMLEMVHYESYNKKWGNDGCHELLNWDKQDEEVKEFCEKYIYPVMIKAEKEERSMFNWLCTLPIHTYDVRPHDEVKGRYSKIGHALIHLVKSEGNELDQEALLNDGQLIAKKIKLDDEAGAKNENEKKEEATPTS